MDTFFGGQASSDPQLLFKVMSYSWKSSRGSNADLTLAQTAQAGFVMVDEKDLDDAMHALQLGLPTKHDS